jgi:hypothetical protein
LQAKETRRKTGDTDATASTQPLLAALFLVAIVGRELDSQLRGQVWRIVFGSKAVNAYAVGNAYDALKNGAV